MEKIIETVVKGFFVAFVVSIMVGLFSFIIAYPVKWCWNMTMPHIFGLPTIGYWQAFFLYFLCGILIRHKSTETKEKK
jgi:heme/copper-type cytochrome/quinol oxidase subunit 4